MKTTHIRKKDTLFRTCCSKRVDHTILWLTNSKASGEWESFEQRKGKAPDVPDWRLLAQRSWRWLLEAGQLM